MNFIMRIGSLEICGKPLNLINFYRKCVGETGELVQYIENLTNDVKGTDRGSKFHTNLLCLHHKHTKQG